MRVTRRGMLPHVHVGTPSTDEWDILTPPRWRIIEMATLVILIIF